MQNNIVYNGIIYRKHPHQKYFYCAESLKRTKALFSRSLHRQMWFDKHGEIPVGYHVHHVDGNAFNNTIENFELIESKWHLTYHAKEKVARDPELYRRNLDKAREFAKAWHGSPEGIAWHTQNAINTGFGKFDYGKGNCLSCNKEFTKKSYQSKYCSNACKSAFRRKNNPDKAPFNCLACGKEYITLKYLPARYCSSQCRPAPNPLGYKARKDLIKVLD